MADKAIGCIIVQMKRLFFLIIFVASVLPSVTSAFTIYSGPEVDASDDAIIEDNLYLLGAKVNFDKTFDNDLVSIGADSNISGALFGDLTSVSSKAILNGEFFGDTRIVSGDTVVEGITNKDLIVVSGKVLITDDAIINGDTVIVAGEVDLRGDVLSDIKIIAGKVNVNSEILGNIEITTQNLHIGSGSNILGDLRYFSPTRASIDEGAKFSSKPIYNQIESISDNGFIKRTVLSFISFWTIIKFLATLFTAFILVFVFRMFSQRVSVIASKNFAKSILIGAVSIFLIPIIVLVLFASLFALPISLIILMLYMITILLVPAVSGIIFGYWIQRYLNRKKKRKIEIDFNSTALGIIILTFIFFIPLLGGLVKMVLFILSFGTIMIYYFEKLSIIKKK